MKTHAFIWLHPPHVQEIMTRVSVEMHSGLRNSIGSIEKKYHAGSLWARVQSASNCAFP